MAIIDEQSRFLQSFRESAPASKPSESRLMRSFENIELAENAAVEQARQEQLLAPRGPSPEQVELKRSMAKFSKLMGWDQPDDITLEVPRAKPAPEKRRDPFTAPLGFKRKDMRPETIAPFEGKDMEAEVRAAMREARPLGEVTSYDALPFKAAFKAAREQGLDSFAWKGKQYTTQMKEEKPKLKTLAVGEERIRPVSEIPLVEEKRPFEVKKGAKLEGVQPEVLEAVNRIAPIFEELGIAQVVTSGMRGAGRWSFHETGDAVDLRFNPRKAFPGLTGEELNKKLTDVRERVREALGAGWDIDLSKHGTGWHLHIEQETEASRQRLHEHGRTLGIKPSEIRSAVSRAKYESFLKEM